MEEFDPSSRLESGMEEFEHSSRLGIGNLEVRAKFGCFELEMEEFKLSSKL